MQQMSAFLSSLSLPDASFSYLFSVATVCWFPDFHSLEGEEGEKVEGKTSQIIQR